MKKKTQIISLVFSLFLLTGICEAREPANLYVSQTKGSWVGGCTESFGFMSNPGDSIALTKSIQKALDQNRDQALGEIVIQDWKSTAQKLFKILCSEKQNC